MLGISSKNAEKGDDSWIESFAKKGFRIIELNHRVKEILFNEKDIRSMKDKIRRYNVRLTLHSGVTDLLDKDRMVNQYQLLLLKSEIKYASRIRAGFIVFHMSRYLDHNKDSSKINRFFTEILRFAKKHKVKLALENNSYGAWSRPEEFLPYFRKYKPLVHALDIGHLNRAVHKKLVKSETNYISMLGRYIDYIHLHGNHGKKDEHKAVGSGNVRLDIILPAIRRLKPEIMIIETEKMEDAIKSRKILRKFGIY